ncbi:MAG: YebC/PmpR family DNA-binding transcriptional regulator [Candidatus Liptonbacteria bacterium]|nr:YebC/PmpR family DNA-binding transcriptional regulator [Candidatus Liptonbacteria bacterium]
MSGHNKWGQIKHQKEITDQKRGRVFSKLLNAVSIAARVDQNPQFNPQLRTAIQKAKDANVPNENIERAIKKTSELERNLDELDLEAYGPGGSAILIEAITDNRNRTVAEIKKILSDYSGKWAESGSVTWAFEKKQINHETIWTPKFPQAIIDVNDSLKLKTLIKKLEAHEDIQKVFSNITN